MLSSDYLLNLYKNSSNQVHLDFTDVEPETGDNLAMVTRLRRVKPGSVFINILQSFFNITIH